MSWISLPHQLNNRKFDKAIVFVHGLNGSAKSWMGDASRFVDRLSHMPAIYNNFGLFVFEYHTKIVEFGLMRKLFALIPGCNDIAQKTKFNVDIRRISMELKTSLRDMLVGYKTIILIGHSMGGIVIKRTLVEMNEAELKRIRLIVSLSVPHIGAGLASISADLFKNPQLIALKKFSDFTSELTNRFSNITDPPESYYQTGSQDVVVKEGSAIPAGVQGDHRIDTDDTHYSVLEIKDQNSHLAFNKVLALLYELLEMEKQQALPNAANTIVDFGIPDHCTFQNAAEILARTANCTIEFKGFSKEELTILLIPQQLRKANTAQALMDLKFIGKKQCQPISL